MGSLSSPSTETNSVDIGRDRKEETETESSSAANVDGSDKEEAVVGSSEGVEEEGQNETW